jgi:hypothetical protein
MDTQQILENAYSISIRDVLPQIDGAKRNHKRVGNEPPDFDYRLDDYLYPSAVFISVAGGEWETIELDWVDITFGSRPYFKCPCGARVGRLYLPKGSSFFRCRKCHQLKYFLTTINKKSIAGQKIYEMNRMQKLVESRESMRKILHNGRFSKRFESFLKQCDKAGLENIVRGAEELKSLIGG